MLVVLTILFQNYQSIPSFHPEPVNFLGARDGRLPRNRNSITGFLFCFLRFTDPKAGSEFRERQFIEDHGADIC